MTVLMTPLDAVMMGGRSHSHAQGFCQHLKEIMTWWRERLFDLHGHLQNKNQYSIFDTIQSKPENLVTRIIT